MQGPALGRTLFAVGVAAALGHLVQVRTGPGTRLDPWIAGGAALSAITGLALLYRGWREAARDLRRLARVEQDRRTDRRRAEAERIAAGGWSDWDHCTQIRRLDAFGLELRRSLPLCMVAGLGLVVLAGDALLSGLLVRQDPLPALAMALAGLAVFFLGHGFVVANGSILRWQGWIFAPLRWNPVDLSGARLHIGKHLGPRSGRHRTGRGVDYRLALVDRHGNRNLIKPCSSPAEARQLAAEIGRLSGVPIEDATGAAAETPRPVPDPPDPPDLDRPEIHARIAELAREAFPDSGGDWKIRDVETRADLILVEVESCGPDETRYRLALYGEADGGIGLAATYVADAEGYALLSSKPGARRRVPARLDPESSAGTFLPG